MILRVINKKKNKSQEKPKSNRVSKYEERFNIYFSQPSVYKIKGLLRYILYFCYLQVLWFFVSESTYKKSALKKWRKNTEHFFSTEFFYFKTIVK